MFTASQKAQFETFGYVMLPQCYSPSEIKLLDEVFQAIMAENLNSTERVEIWTCVIDFALQYRQLTRTLIEDDRLFTAIEKLLGPDFVWYGTSCNLFGGDSPWHPDQHEYDIGSIKALLYLEPLRLNNGCLRVIPGSHRPHLHEALEPEQPPSNNPKRPMFGLSGPEVPACALETDPGDLIIFNKCLWHAAFGATENRRMVSFSFAPHSKALQNIQYFSHFFQEELAVQAPQPSVEHRLRHDGSERLANIIGTLTGLGLHCRS